VARFRALSGTGGLVRHNRFAETLQLYWDQDSVSREEAGNLVLYNFEHVRRLYLLLNRATRQVIGGTSPATLFIAAPPVFRRKTLPAVPTGTFLCKIPLCPGKTARVSRQFPRSIRLLGEGTS